MDAEATLTEPAVVSAKAWPRRLAVGLVLLAAVGAGGWWLLARWRNGEGAPTWATTPAAKGDVVSQVTASGTLRPVLQVQVGSQVSGRIKELFADYNDTVTKGEIVAKIDPQLFESAVEQAEARLSAARADLKRSEALAANAAIKYKRLEGLDKTGAVASTDIDAALSDQRAAEAQSISSRAEVTLAQASLDQAKVNLAYTTIASPIDGIVIARSVDVGQTVAASLQAPTLFLIAGDLRKMEVHTSVAESDVGQIRAGMRVEFTVDAFPDRTFPGVVKQVRYEAVAVTNVVTYDAVVNVDNDDLALRPGMTANTSFIVDERHGVLVVSNKALRFRPKGVEAPAPGAGSGGGSGRWNGGSGGSGSGGSGGGAWTGSGGRRGGRRGQGEGSEAVAGAQTAPAAPGTATPATPATPAAPATVATPATPPGKAPATPAPNGSPPAQPQPTDQTVAAGQAAAPGVAAGRRRGRPQTVYVLRNGAAVAVRVITGLTDGTVTEVVGGDLQEGDLVISGDGGSTAAAPSQQRRMGPPRIL